MWRGLIFLLSVFVLVMPGLAQRSRAAPDDFDVPYGEDRFQRVDVYLPQGVDSPPVLFLVHGGGYFFGDKTALSRFAEAFRQQGYAVVSVNYRLVPRVTYPALIEDVVCALAWTHAQTETYGYDASRLFVMGDSAGGNAVSLLGTSDDLSVYLNGCDYAAPESWLRGVIAYYPIVDLNTCERSCEGARRAMAIYLGEEEYDPAYLGAASVLAGLNGNEAPFLLIHGMADIVVPVSESEDFAYRLREAGVGVDLLLIRGADHGFVDVVERGPGREAAEAVQKWLEAQLAQLAD